MNRRQFLRTSAGVTTVVGIARCSNQSTTERKTPQGDPTVSWDHEQIRDEEYSVTVTIQMNGANELTITRQFDPIRTVTDSGTYTVAGPDRDGGPAERSDIFAVQYPIEYESDWVNTYQVTTAEMQETTPGEQSEPPEIPLFLRGVRGSTGPESIEDASSTRVTFTTNHQDNVYQFWVEIPETMEEYYTARYRTREYGAYVSDRYDDEYLNQITNEFKSKSSGGTRSDIETIDHLMTFVQKLEYSKDKVATGFNEYPKYPAETLLDKGGDCEDTCILLASMLEQLGYDAVLLGYFEQQHMAVGLAGDESIEGTSVEHNGREYYYVETTAPGYSIGDVPRDSFRNATPEVIRIDAHPVCVFNYVVDVNAEEGGVTVESNIRNEGDAAAESVRLQVEFQTRDEETVAIAESESVRLSEETTKTVSMSAEPPDDREQRVKASLYVDGQLHDTVQSDFQEPFLPGTDT